MNHSEPDLTDFFLIHFILRKLVFRHKNGDYNNFYFNYIYIIFFSSYLRFFQQ